MGPRLPLPGRGSIIFSLVREKVVRVFKGVNNSGKCYKTEWSTTFAKRYM